MKIGIITLPFNSNYGGILQAYALQKVLIDKGHEVQNVNRFSKGIGISTKMKVLSFGSRFIKRYLFGKKVPVRIWPTKKEQEYMAQNTYRFIKENIQLTKYVNDDAQLSTLNHDGFNAFVVGSDQVWRPRYSPKIENHFFEFVTDQSIKKIAYAASFGVDHWEYSEIQTANCKKLASQFKAISVRENTGVELCKKHLSIDALQVLDPTMLLDKADYEALVAKDQLPERKENLLTYVLDISPEIKATIEKVEQILNLKSFSTMPENLFRYVGKEKIDECIAPPVTNWIKGFMDAEFVFTDSFHGTVFSILFNKQFVSIGNTKRGVTRFTSLLSMFGLEDRLLTESDLDIEKRINNKIDYDRVNKLLNEKREEAISFLTEAINN